MSKMLRKKIGQVHVCPYGELCCSTWPMGRRAKRGSIKLQRRIARRREMNTWKKENN